METASGSEFEPSSSDSGSDSEDEVRVIRAAATRSGKSGGTVNGESEVSKAASASSSQSVSQNCQNPKRRIFLPVEMPSKDEILMKIAMRKKRKREYQAKRRAEMTPEQKAALRLKDTLAARERRRKINGALMERLKGSRSTNRNNRIRRRQTAPPAYLPEECRNEFGIMNQIRNKIKAALETPSAREARLALKKETGKKAVVFVENREERELREILVREAFAVEIGKEQEMKKFQMNRDRELRLRALADANSTVVNSKTNSNASASRNISKTDRAVLEFWDNKDKWDGIISFGDGIISSDDEDSEESEENTQKSGKGVQETEAEWSERVSDIFNSRVKDNNTQSIPQQQTTQFSITESQVNTINNTIEAAEAPDQTQNATSALSRKEELISIVSAEKAERVVIVEAEIAERRAALAGETEEERKARIENWLREIKKGHEHGLRCAETRRKRQKDNQTESEESNAVSKQIPRAPWRKKGQQLSVEEVKRAKEHLAKYMRERNDLYMVEWETWVGLREASATPGLCQITSEVTGVVNAQGALNWLEENMEDHRWGITTGASVKMSYKVPEAVKKYRLSLATLIDKDEKRFGPNAKRVAKETLLALLTTERKILEEYFYSRRTYVQRMCTKSVKKNLDVESLAERKARLNERLRERYKANRLRAGKTYDPVGRGGTRKDKETFVKELKGEIPRSTRGITKNPRRGFSWRRKTVVVKNGRALPISNVLFDKPPGEREVKDTDVNSTEVAVDTAPREQISTTNIENQQVIPTSCDDNPIASVSEQTTSACINVSKPAAVQPEKRSLRSNRKTSKETLPPSPLQDPEEQDSDSDWAPADVDESLFDDDDSRDGGVSVEDSSAPTKSQIQDNWNTSPTLEPFSTINQSHLYSQSMYSHAAYSSEQRSFQTFPPPIDVGHGILLGNPVPAFPTLVQTQTQNPTRFQPIPILQEEASIPVLSSSQGYTPSDASSACSNDCGPSTLSSEETSSSVPDVPPQRKRRGRPPSSSSAHKRVKNTISPTPAKRRKPRTKCEKVTLKTSLLRPEDSFIAGKVPTVAFPGLLVDPSKNNSTESTEMEPIQSLVLVPNAPEDPMKMNSPEASVNFVPKDPVNIPDVRENSSNIFKCPKCSETFEDQEKLNSHECEKHSRNDKNREVEGLEEKLDTDSRSRDENEEKLKSDKIQHFKCPLCDAILRDYKGGHVFTNHLWTVHWKDELNSDLGPCPLCLRTLKGQGARYFFYLTRHILRCHADLPKTTFIPGLQGAAVKTKDVACDKFYCIVCSSCFPAYLPLAKHVENGHSRACHVCGIVLQLEDHLKDHVQIFHPQESYIPQEIMSGEKLKSQVHCARCRSKFIDTDHLKSHEELCEEKISSYKCWWNCSESGKFKTLEALENHHKEHHEHDTIVPNEGYESLHLLYKCELCAHRCATLPVLRLHYMKAHPSAPPLPEVNSFEPEMVHNLRPQLHKDTVNATPKIRIRNTAKSEEFPELKKLSRQTKKVEEVAYNCGECPKGFTPSEFCLLHRGYTKTQKRCCRTCGVQYSTITALIVHNKTKHGISAEENSSLEKEYEDKRLQIAKERKEPILKCGLCFKVFVATDFHTMHSTMGDVLDPDLQTCPHCPNRSFFRKHDLDKHMDLCHSDPETAAKTAKRIQEQRQRQKEKAKENPSKQKETDVQDWTCDQCGSIFTLRQSLQRHIKNMHSGMGKRFQCPHCEYKSARLEQLRTHIKVIHQSGKTGRNHTPRPPPPPRVHIPDKKCPKCIKKFATERALQIHVEKAHGQETLCYACGDSFRDIKAHNKVCSMGGIEEDSILGDLNSKVPKATYHKVQTLAKLPLLALLHLVRQQKDQICEGVAVKKQSESIKKKARVKTEAILSLEEDKESESAADKSPNKAETEKELRVKSSIRISKHNRASKKDTKRPKTKHKHKKSKKAKSSKGEKSRRRGRKKKKIDSDDENTEDEVDGDFNWDDGAKTEEEEEIEITIKEELEEVSHDEEFCFDVELDETFAIQPDEATCSVENCPCERGKWAEIVHSDRVITVPLVRCDPEVQAIQERRQLEAEIERDRKEAEETERQKILAEEKEQRAMLEKANVEQERRRRRAEYARERRRKLKLEKSSTNNKKRLKPAKLTEAEKAKEQERKRRKVENERERRRRRRMGNINEDNTTKYPANRNNLEESEMNVTPNDDIQSSPILYAGDSHAFNARLRSSKSPDPCSVEGWTQLNHIILSHGDTVDLESSSDEDINQDPLAL